MYVKNFRARSSAECILKLKADMGRDAVILQSRTIRPIFGRFGPAMHEIVAASDVDTIMDKLGAAANARNTGDRELRPRLELSTGDIPTPAPESQRTARLTLAEAAELAERGMYHELVAAGIVSQPGRTPAASAPQVSAPAPQATDPGEDRLAQLEDQLARLTEAISQGRASAPIQQPQPVVVKTDSPASGIGGFLRYRVPAQTVAAPAPTPPEPTRLSSTSDVYLPVLEQLRHAQVADAILRRLRDEMLPAATAGEARAAVHSAMVRRMLIGGTIAPQTGKIVVAALLGPTGVGKTTTIAKLAANLSLEGGVSVGMITLDTQRVAAIQQLSTYGEIMQIPLGVANDKAEMEKILIEFAQKEIEVVLVDTPGSGPGDTLSLAEMSVSLGSLVNLITYLVIPATLSAANFEHTITRFRKLANPDAIILTKMDETADNHCLGFLVNAQAKYQLPLAYVTMGARVPDDLLAADAHLLVSKLLTPSVLQA